MCFSCVGCSKFARGEGGVVWDKSSVSCVPGTKTSENCVSGISCLLISSSSCSVCVLAVLDLILLVDIARTQLRILDESQDNVGRPDSTVAVFISA